MIAIDAVHVKEMQRFTTYADPHETVGGFWSLTYPGELRGDGQIKQHLRRPESTTLPADYRCNEGNRRVILY